MTDVEKIIEGLNETISYFQALSGNTPERCAQHLRDAIAFLKEQEDMIPISTVAEYIAQYAAPPVRSPLAVYGDLVKAWERFFEGLKKREKQDD